MIFLLVCSLVVPGILVALALSQISDLNKRVNTLMLELFKLPGLESKLKRLERELEGLRDGSPHSHSAPPSVVGLGLILLGVSYAYQRYRHLLLGATGSPSDDAGAS